MIYFLNNIYEFCKYKYSSHRLSVETKKWYNISRNDRLYQFSTCSFFNNERQKYFPYYCQKNANILKFNKLFSSHKIVVLEKMCTFYQSNYCESLSSRLGNIFCFCTLYFIVCLYVVFIYS